MKLLVALMFVTLSLFGCRDRTSDPAIAAPASAQDLAPAAAKPAPSADAAPETATPDAGQQNVSPPADKKQPTAQTSAPAPSDQAAECQSAKDCIEVTLGCCSCTAGGRKKVISKAQLEDYQKSQRASCGVTHACPAVMSSDASCFKDKACRAGKCVLVPRK